MKKLFLGLFFAAAFAVSAFAQPISVGRTQKVEKPYHLVDVNTAIPDSSTAFFRAWDFTALDQPVYYTHFVQFNGTRKSAEATSPKIQVYTAYSYDNVTWHNLDTAYFSGTVSDTLIEIESISTATGYPYQSISVFGVDSVYTRIDYYGLRWTY